MRQHINSLLSVLMISFTTSEALSDVTLASHDIRSALLLQHDLKTNDQIGVISAGSDISSDINNIINGKTFLSQPQNKEDKIYLILENNSFPYLYNDKNIVLERGHIIIYGLLQSDEEHAIARNARPVISLNPHEATDALSIIGIDAKLTLKNISIDALDWMSGRAVISIKDGGEVVHSDTDIYRDKAAPDARDQNNYYHLIYFLGDQKSINWCRSILNISGNSLLFNGLEVGGLIFTTTQSSIDILNTTLVVAGSGTVIGATGAFYSNLQKITLQNNTIYGCAANTGSSLSKNILHMVLPQVLCGSFNGRIEASFIRKLPRYRFQYLTSIAGSDYSLSDNTIYGRFGTIFTYAEHDNFTGSGNRLHATGRLCQIVYDLSGASFFYNYCNKVERLLSN